MRPNEREELPSGNVVGLSRATVVRFEVNRNWGHQALNDSADNPADTCSESAICSIGL